VSTPVRWRVVLAAVVVAVPLAACGPAEPVRIGFLGGLSGRVSDLGDEGLRGATLAVERVNAQGGIKGRPVVLVAADDQQDPAVAPRALASLIEQKVVAVVGPMTSSMAVAVLPASARAGVLMVSPTVTASSLTGKDDTLFTVASSTSVYAAAAADHLASRGLRRVIAFHDERNAAYTRDWLEGLRARGRSVGVEVARAEPFSSGDYVSYDRAVSRMAGVKADAVVYVSNALDTVRLMQKMEAAGWRLPALGVSWSATEQLLQIGGRKLEGMVHVQMYDPGFQSVRYQSFVEDFRQRYKEPPAFAAMLSYDAVMALARAMQREEALNRSLVATGPYEGLQGAWSFNAQGDGQRVPFMSVISEGRYQPIR
jgi:branched-chain amino acid transport system substrate-binding protein